MTASNSYDRDHWPAKQNLLTLLPFINNKNKMEKTIEDSTEFFTFNKPFQILIKAMWGVPGNRKAGKLFYKGLDSKW